MKLEEINRKLIEMKAKPGDLIKIVYENGYEEKVVLDDEWLGFLMKKSRTLKSGFDYIILSGLSWHYLGDCLDLAHIKKITAWVPRTKKEKECVRKIREDLERAKNRDIEHPYRYVK